MNAEKKKLMIIGLLAACLVGVGVFQFVAGSGSPTPPPEAKSDKSSDDPSSAEGKGLVAQNAETADPVRDLYKWPLAQRDPFAKNMAALAPLTQNQPPQQTTPPSNPPTKRPAARPPIEPFNLEGLPFVNNGSGGNVQIENGQPLRQPGELTYTLSGVILGSKPAAVFTDDAGNQRLVQAGGSLDSDCKVLSVSQNQVVLRHHGKTKTLTLGGNPNAQ